MLTPLYAYARSVVSRNLAGLTDAEYHWEPVPGWSIRSGAAGWTLEWEDPEPEPAPFTTIAWRLVHLAGVTTMYDDHTFGTRSRDWDDDVIPGDAAGAVAWWETASAAFAEHLDGLDPDVPVAPPWASFTTAGQMARIVVHETIHHGAEIGCVRDLYRGLGSPA